MRRKRGKVEGDVRKERDRENLFIEVPILASCLGWLYNFLITFHIIFSFPIPKPHNSGRENNSPTVKLSPPRWPPPIFRLHCNSFNRYTLFFFSKLDSNYRNGRLTLISVQIHLKGGCAYFSVCVCVSFCCWSSL